MQKKVVDEDSSGNVDVLDNTKPKAIYFTRNSPNSLGHSPTHTPSVQQVVFKMSSFFIDNESTSLILFGRLFFGI